MTIWSGCLPPISARPFNRRSCCVPLMEEATPATPTGFHFLPPPKSLFRQGHHLTKQAKRAIIPIQKTVFQTAECGRWCAQVPGAYNYLHKMYTSLSHGSIIYSCPSPEKEGEESSRRHKPSPLASDRLSLGQGRDLF